MGEKKGGREDRRETHQWKTRPEREKIKNRIKN